MRNVKIERDGDDLIIRVDVTKSYGPSSSGKSEIIGSSGGFAALTDGSGASVNLTVTRSLTA